MTEKRVVIAGSSVIVYDDIEIAKSEAIQHVMGSLIGKVVVYRTKDGWFGSALKYPGNEMPDGLTTEYYGEAIHEPKTGYRFSGWRKFYPPLSADEIQRRTDGLLSVTQTIISDTQLADLAVKNAIDEIGYLLRDHIVVYGVIAADSQRGERTLNSHLPQVAIYAAHEEFFVRVLADDEPCMYAVNWDTDQWGWHIQLNVGGVYHEASSMNAVECCVIVLFAKEKLP